MKRTIAMCGALLGLSGTASAAPKPITIWVYGDGETTRMLSELTVLNDPATTKITIVNKAKIGSGPLGAPEEGGDLIWRIASDLSQTPAASYPKVIHIGYNASAASYWFCSAGALADWPEREGEAIRAAADYASFGGAIKVLLSKGTGFPDPSVGAPDRSCLQGASARTTWYLAINAPSYQWTDYSGMTAGVGSASPPPVAWQLDRSKGGLWEADHVHVSCDKKRYTEPTAGCITLASEAARKDLGAWRVAQTVFKAYKALQSQF